MFGGPNPPRAIMTKQLQLKSFDTSEIRFENHYKICNVFVLANINPDLCPYCAKKEGQTYNISGKMYKVIDVFPANGYAFDEAWIVRMELV